MLDVPRLAVNMFVELIGAVQSHRVKSCERRGCHGNEADTHTHTPTRENKEKKCACVRREIRLNKMHAPTPETNRRYSNESNLRGRSNGT